MDLLAATKKLKSLLRFKKPRHLLAARVLHWTYAPAVLAGIVSGFYVNNPSPFRNFKRMDSARKVHFIAQYILLFSYLGRVYYGFAEKNYREIILGRKDLGDMPRFLKYELFLSKKKPQYVKYNPAQKIIFSHFALLLPLQLMTGFALYASHVLQKPASIAGGLNPLRKMHYLVALTISSMAAGHIYFALTNSLKKLKSIFTGSE